MAPRRIEIGMGGGGVAGDPGIIATDGLGSCVALSLYDGRLRIGGLAHIMLPGAEDADVSWLPCQYADKALNHLLGELLSQGTCEQDMVAKIAGGASMFANSSGQGIGELNIVGVKRLLKVRGIPLVGEDVGGAYGRQVEFHLDSGKMVIRFVGKEVRII